LKVPRSLAVAAGISFSVHFWIPQKAGTPKGKEILNPPISVRSLIPHKPAGIALTMHFQAGRGFRGD
jgi:hypothetical protein